MAAGAIGLGPGLVSFLAAQRSSSRPWLDVAVRCGAWIDKAAQDRSGGLAWPADPLKPATVGLDFYNGMPGVVYFFANLYAATGDPRWRDRAERGGAYLAATAALPDEKVNAGLYTGIAGLGTTYMALETATAGSTWTAHAKAAAASLVARARNIGDGADWSDSNDIVSGTAGTGLFLLAAARAWQDRALGALAVRAGRRLIAQGVPAEGGLMWFPAGQRGANYPNFSHGTAGVGYFLATLHEASGEHVFLDAALAGARYLDAIATRRDGARAVFHVTGGGENRFYLSWCHGPVGTARLYYRLYRISGDVRHRRAVDELTSWLMSSGAPEQQSAGYWNNISQCCGHVGIGQYAIDLARQGWATPAGLAARVVESTLSRASDDADGLRWVQAENRVSPANLVAQTGFMQGAAGVGTFFLQLDAFERSQRWRTPLPDTPWT